jgi:hypothetical protein
MAQRRGRTPRKSSRRVLRRGRGRTPRRTRGTPLRIWTIVMFLVCIAAGVGIGWLTNRGNLEAAQTMGASLKAENEQYVSSLAEANRQVEIANERVTLADATIGKLEQKLAESAKISDYWWERAHPREFASFDELKAWLAQDNTDKTIYIFGNGCLSNYNSDDYALALARNALRDGYLVSLQVEDGHVLNSTIIGDKIYFIEPQSDEAWLGGYRDS